MALLSRFSILNWCAWSAATKIGSMAVPSSQMEEVMRALLAITSSIFIAASVFGAFGSVRAQDKAGPETKLKAMGIDVTNMNHDLQRTTPTAFRSAISCLCQALAPEVPTAR